MYVSTTSIYRLVLFFLIVPSSESLFKGLNGLVIDGTVSINLKVAVGLSEYFLR